MSSTANDELGSMSELFRVAAPLMISAGSQAMMSAVDRMVLAGCSEAALAAVTPASMLNWTVVCVPMGTVMYANTFISQYDGANRPDRMMASLWQAIWLALIAGFVLLVCLPFTRPILSMTDHQPDVIEYEAQYFNTLCAGSPITLLAVALSCYFNGRRMTHVAMFISFISVFLNFVLDYLFVYGIGSFPELGVRGAALATVLARLVEACIYVVLIIRHLKGQPVLKYARFDLELIRKFFRYGVPSGLHYFVDNSGFTAFLMIIGSLSRSDLAATNLAFAVNALIFVPLLGFGTAIQTLVGHHMGAERVSAASRTVRNAFIMGLIWTGGTGIMLVAAPEFCLRPFFLFAKDIADGGPDLKTLTATAATLLSFVAIYSAFDGLAVVYSAALRGAGDTVYPMLVTLICSWLVMVLPAWLLLHYEQATIQRLWMTCSANIVLTGGLMILRFSTGRWKSIRLAKDAESHLPDAGTP